MTRTVQHSSTINISTSTCTVLTGCSELAIPWPNQIVFQVQLNGPCIFFFLEELLQTCKGAKPSH